VSTTRGSSSANFFGKRPGERVGRFDDVVVDGDDGVRALARLGLGQPGDRLAPALAAAEVLVAREVVERHDRSRQHLGFVA
jgi:hypothetical protein